MGAMTRGRVGLLAALSALLLQGCMVGPDYKGPPTMTAASGQAFTRGQAVRGDATISVADWWTVLGDPTLDRLETTALAASPDLAAAEARVREGRAKLASQQAELLPTTGTSALYLHTHGGAGLLSSLAGSSSQSAAASSQAAGAGSSSEDFDFYEVGFDATWEVDLFGGKRRAAQAAAASTQAQIANLADAQVSLTADVARAYVNLRDQQQRLALAQKTVALQQKMRALTEQRAAAGTASTLDVTRLDTEVEQSQGDLIPLQAGIEEQLDLLATLTAQAPGALDALLAVPGPVPLPPSQVAVGDPASLLRRRPDIRAAERQIASNNATIGQHVADYFPKLQLLGNLGFSSTDVSQLFDGGAFSTIVAPILQWKPFDFGRTAAAVHEAKAERDEAVAQYESTVLKALNDAETALSRYGYQEKAVANLERVKASADEAARLTRMRYQGGTTTLTDVLDTERQRVQSEQGLAQGQAELTQDFVALEKSLGLGWGAGS